MGRIEPFGYNKGGLPRRVLGLNRQLVQTKKIIHTTITMKQTTAIDFTQNVTTTEAFMYIGRFTLVIVRNLSKAIDKAAHQWPWAFIIVVFLASTVTSFVLIGQARAERDHYNKENYQLTQELSKYKAALGVDGSKENND